MSQESIGGKPSQEKEKEVPVNMSNFYFYLPDTSYRKFAEDKGTDSKKVIEVVDSLLANEFSHLDTKRIYEAIKGANQAAIDFLNSMRDKSPEELAELKEALEPKIEAAKKADEELRPLFNKLVKMGFDPKLLAK